MKSQFDKYVNVIRKSAHFYADKYHLEYDDVEAEGFRIYLEALENFNPEKSSFITHLTWELKRLNYFCIKEIEYKKNFVSMDNYKEIEISDENNFSLEDILRMAKNEISEIAYNILKWILSWDWRRKNVLKPTVNLAMQKFGMSRKDIIPYWNEIGSFYKNILS